MTWLINGGKTTGFCLVDGGEVRYTKTLATPYDLSRCLFDCPATAQVQEDLLAARVGDRWGPVSPDVGDSEALSRELTARVNDLSARGARRLVSAVSGSDGADGEAPAKGRNPRHLLGAVPLLFSWEVVADPLRYPRTWSSLLNAFLHRAIERFLFNADRRLRDAPARSRCGSSA
jgi:hypothetical protein